MTYRNNLNTAHRLLNMLGEEMGENEKCTAQQ